MSLLRYQMHIIIISAAVVQSSGGTILIFQTFCQFTYSVSMLICILIYPTLQHM